MLSLITDDQRGFGFCICKLRVYITRKIKRIDSSHYIRTLTLERLFSIGHYFCIRLSYSSRELMQFIITVFMTVMSFIIFMNYGKLHVVYSYKIKELSQCFDVILHHLSNSACVVAIL